VLRQTAEEVALTAPDLAAVEAAGLAGRELIGLEAAGEGTAVVVEVASGEMLDAWRRARAAVPEAGRWPVLITAPAGIAPWGQAFIRSNPFNGLTQGCSTDPTHVSDASPSDVLRGADTLNLPARLGVIVEHRSAWGRENLDLVVDSHVDVTRRLCGRAPTARAVRVAMSGIGDPDRAADRFLLEWEMANGFDRKMAPDPSYLDWFEPAQGDVIGLALLPTSRPWAVHAIISSLYDASWYGDDLVVAIARKWFESFGAEPVALWGTMVQLLVDRPPRDLETAYTVAWEQWLLAESTLVGPGIFLRQHARALRGRRSWFLHSRP
jgi:hypothetical protein